MLVLRDALAHGKTESVRMDLEVDDPEDESASYPVLRWKSLCAKPSVCRMVEDAERIVRDLIIKAGITWDPFACIANGWSGVSLIK
jgi:hypothetical protein